jgi:hypothetical protein
MFYKNNQQGDKAHGNRNRRLYCQNNGHKGNGVSNRASLSWRSLQTVLWIKINGKIGARKKIRKEEKREE